MQQYLCPAERIFVKRGCETAESQFTGPWADSVQPEAERAEDDSGYAERRVGIA